MMQAFKTTDMQSHTRVNSHSLIFYGTLEHGEVREQPQDAGLSVRHLPFWGFRALMSFS